ncbi:MAG TPA: hypothetical protein VIC26_13380 [Marinagarivorans sp.]
MKTFTPLVLSTVTMALLAGCDGATITIEPNNASSSHSVSSSSVALVQSSSASSVDICDSDMPPPGAPACYKITPECEAGSLDCEPVEFRVSDYCGVRGLNAEVVDVAGLGECDALNLTDYNRCAELDGSTFLSTTLGEGGATPEGVSQMHWRFTFDDGQVRLIQSDFGLIGSYACRDNQVIVTLDTEGDEEYILDIDDRLHQFTFDPLGTGAKTYQNVYGAELTTDACSKVAGNSYVLLNDATSPLELDYYLHFGESVNSVTYSDGSKEEEGYYDCAWGELQVHTPSHQEPPKTVSVADDGSSVTLTRESGLPSITLLIDKPTMSGICDDAYLPVCAAQNVQCVTEPCLPVHKTYTNDCGAESDGATILFEGECGELEGSPVESLPVACPAVYDPVCAKRHRASIECVTSPCPNYEYKTYSNACSAGAEFAAISFESECDTYNLNGVFSFEHKPVRLDMEEDASLKSVTLISASIEDDVMTAKVGYSGCGEQAINFTLATTFAKSNPVQADGYFSKTIDDACQAYFETTVKYDLLPLQVAYKTLYQATEGTIIINDVGRYEF